MFGAGRFWGVDDSQPVIGLITGCAVIAGLREWVGLRQLLSMDALSCDHVRVRGFFSLGPDTMYCQSCGGHRRFLLSGRRPETWEMWFLV